MQIALIHMSPRIDEAHASEGDEVWDEEIRLLLQKAAQRFSRPAGSNQHNAETPSSQMYGMVASNVIDLSKNVSALIFHIIGDHSSIRSR